MIEQRAAVLVAVEETDRGVRDVTITIVGSPRHNRDARALCGAKKREQHQINTN